MRPYLALLLFAAAGPLLAQEDGVSTLRGRVVDSRTGEPIAKALVSIRDRRLEAVTDEAGCFKIPGVPRGSAELYVSTVGYGLVKRTVHVPPDADEHLVISLGQEAIKRSEAVSVTSTLFDPIDRDAPSQYTLDSTERKNLASVLADDSLRSVQTLPGVATGDDFDATFSLRGSGFGSMGFYIDGVLTRSPFHTIRDVNDGYSLTILNGDLVDSIALVSSAAPARYGDRVASVLNVQTRDGSRERVATRANLGAAGVSFTNEGPIGRQKKASWLVGGRKSFLDYVISRLDTDPSLVLGYYDLQGKLAYDPTGAHHLSLFILHGDANWKEDTGSGPNARKRANARTDLLTGRWRWSPSGRTVLTATTYLYAERARTNGRNEEILFRSDLRDAGLRADISRALGSRHTVEAGLLVKRLREEALARRFDQPSNRFQVTNQYDASTWQPGAYAQDTWTAVPGRLSLTFGGRFDRLGSTGEEAWSPRASATLSLSSRTRVSAAFGRYSQFPWFSQLFGAAGNPRLEPERSTHYVLALERLLADSVRFSIQAYDQQEEGRIFALDSEFRLVDGRLVRPRPVVVRNALSGPSRGVELCLQRRSANGLSGWVSYALGRARLVDQATGLRFDSDFDQRHTVNAYASYRMTNSLSLSAKYRYGSNVPIAGFYRSKGDAFFLAEDRNRVRVPPYSRLDVRAAKAFFYTRWKMTLYAEIANVLDRTHYRYSGDGSLDPRTGRVFLERDKPVSISPGRRHHRRVLEAGVPFPAPAAPAKPEAPMVVSPCRPGGASAPSCNRRSVLRGTGTSRPASRPPRSRAPAPRARTCSRP